MVNDTPGGLSAVWGTGANDVWAVGDVALHWNGVTWENTFAPTNGFTDVWAADPTTAWAVAVRDDGSETGLIYKWDGSAWSQDADSTTGTLRAISGSSAADVWAAGESDVLMHWNGSEWNSVPTNTTVASLESLWASDTNVLWAIGYGDESVLQRSRADWIVHKNLTTRALRRIHGSGDSSVWAVGYEGTVLRWNGSEWKEMTSGQLPALLNDVYLAASGEAYAVGSGTILRRTAEGTWTQAGPALSQDYRAVHGSSETNVWVVGAGGFALHWDGSVWTPHATGTTKTLNAVFVRSPKDAWAVGRDGLAIHWNGYSWEHRPLPASREFLDVWATESETIAVGMNGLAYRYSAGSWSALSTDTTEALYGVWGTDANNVWIVGSGGLILHVTGLNSLARVASPTSASLSDISGSGANSVWAVAPSGEFLHWNGASWERYSSGTSKRMTAISVSGTRGLSVGDYSVLSR